MIPYRQPSARAQIVNAGTTALEPANTPGWVRVYRACPLSAQHPKGWDPQPQILDIDAERIYGYNRTPDSSD